MLAKKLTKAVREIPIEVNRFLCGQYPSFVGSPSPQPLCEEVPVFMFHSVEANRFEEQLQFLKTNGYQTLRLDAFMRFLHGDLRLAAPSVLLTFDDGDRSWYEVAGPLLRKYGYNAVGFLVPHYLDRIAASDLERFWMTWEEVIALQDEGLFEFESHSQFHDRIFTGPQLVDFMHPGFVLNNLGLDVQWVDRGDGYTNALPLGTPILRHEPRLGASLRYVDSKVVADVCVAHVEQHGGSAFFEDRHWRKKLRKVWAAAMRSSAPGHYEGEKEQIAAMARDLELSRKRIGEVLQKEVRHFCYPWGCGSALAVEASKEAGYVSNFWVTVPGRNINRVGDDPYAIVRLKDDYLLRLPGKGRERLLSVFWSKLRRRKSKVFIY